MKHSSAHDELKTAALRRATGDAWMDAPQSERCPTCLSPMEFKHPAAMAPHELPEAHPEGAWFCTDPNCYTSHPPGAERFPFAHPDPWMDNEPGRTTFPADWR